MINGQGYIFFVDFQNTVLDFFDNHTHLLHNKKFSDGGPLVIHPLLYTCQPFNVQTKTNFFFVDFSNKTIDFNNNKDEPL